MAWKFEKTSTDAFKHWDDEGFPHGKVALSTKYPGTKRSQWKKFKCARQKYLEGIESGQDHFGALASANKSYPTIVLEKLRSYKPTKHDVGVRRGPHPPDMKRKRGRKRKASAGTFKRLSKK